MLGLAPSALATVRWRPTGSLNAGRVFAAANLLKNGKVLVVGGSDGAQIPASAELYDPAAHTCSATGALYTGHFGAAVALLQNGKVLVAGGGDSTGTFLSTAELYDPAAGRWSPTGSGGEAA